MSVNSKLTAIADAIREKTGESGTLTLDAMAAAIAGIEAGGGGGFPNGTEWTQSNVTSGEIRSLEYANGVWVAAHYNNGIYYSTDGMTWTQSNVTTRTLDLCHGKGIWVARVRSNGLYYSTDGMTWVQSNLTNTALSGSPILFEKGVWVYGGDSSNANIYYSTDGMTWMKSNVTGNSYETLAYADGVFVASGKTKKAYYSTDGIAWTQSNISNEFFRSVHGENGMWVACAGTSDYSGANTGIYYSTDGKTWTQSNVTSNTTNLTISYVGGVWYACAEGSGHYYSTDGMTWTQSNVIIFNPESEGGVLVAGSSSDNGIYYSTDGKTWTQSNVTTRTVRAVKNQAGVWVASASYDYAYYSIDGITWEPSTFPNFTSSKFSSDRFTVLMNENGIWVGGHKSYGLFYSPTWQPA